MKPAENRTVTPIRTPPHSIESEQSLIGSLLLDNQCLDRIAGIVTEADFYRDDHRRIFRHIAALIKAGNPADAVTVHESLERVRESEQAGGLAYLGEIANNTPSSANATGYARLVRDNALRRKLIAAADELQANAFTSPDIDALIRSHETSIADVQGSRLGDLEDVDVSSLLATPPAPIEWLAKERIQLGRGGLLVGIGGSSKTRTQYHIAIGAIVGRLPWGWDVCRVGSAALILAEDTEEDVHRTLAATLNAIGATRAERDMVSRNLHILALAGKECRLIDVHDGVAGENARYAELLRKLCSYPNLVFVGLDPALAFTAGDELDQAHQRALGRMADSIAVQTGAAVLMTAHSAKGNQNTEELSSHSARGGGAITDAVRAEFSLRTMTAAEAAKAGISDIAERKRHVQLVATKGNHLPPDAYVPVWLRRGDHGALSAADVSMGGACELKTSTADLKARDVLEKLCETKTPGLSEWRDECVRVGIISVETKEGQRKAMQRIADRLIEAGLVTHGVGRGIYLPVVDAQ